VGSTADNGVAGHFTTGSGGGRYGDARHRLGLKGHGFADHLKIVGYRSRIGDQGGDGFGGIHDAAAAESNDHIAALCTCQLSASGDARHIGFTVHRKTGHLQPGPNEICGQAVGAGRGGAGDQENMTGHGGGQIGHMVHRSRSEHNAAGGGK
jgi:hypothetical protein